jgi:hypothetical protein
MGIRGWRKLSTERTECRRITEINPQWVVTPIKEDDDEEEKHTSYQKACI